MKSVIQPYAQEGGCASVCLNVCKLPTQQFFNEEVGLPVTLEPNYETFECQFVYGKTPPPPELDKAFNTPCFSQCPITKMGAGGSGAGAGAGEGGGGGTKKGVVDKNRSGSASASSVVEGSGGSRAWSSSALGEVPRWIASTPAAAAAAAAVGAGDAEEDDCSSSYDEDGKTTSNCSRLPAYVGEDSPAPAPASPVVMRRNHPGPGGTKD